MTIIRIASIPPYTTTKYEVWHSEEDLRRIEFASTKHYVGGSVSPNVYDIEMLRDLIELTEQVEAGSMVFGLCPGGYMKVIVWLNQKDPFAVVIQHNDPLLSSLRDPELLLRRIMKWETK